MFVFYGIIDEHNILKIEIELKQLFKVNFLTFKCKRRNVCGLISNNTVYGAYRNYKH